MRRRIRFLLPLFLLAVWAQVFAPLGAGLMMAASSDGALTEWVCAQSGASDLASPDHAPAPHHDHDDCCGLCQAAHAPPPTLHPALIGLVSPPALYRLFTRYVPDETLPAAFLGEQTRARAPPRNA